MKRISIKTGRRIELVDITSRVQEMVKEKGVADGVCIVYVPHTTAGVTINEGADPSVARDMEVCLARLIPEKGDYKHLEGNSDAHMKATLAGSSQTIFVEDGRLVLGTWQAIYFCEFDGPRSREVLVKVIAG